MTEVETLRSRIAELEETLRERDQRPREIIRVTCELRAPSSFGEPIACCNPAVACQEHVEAFKAKIAEREAQVEALQQRVRQLEHGYDVPETTLRQVEGERDAARAQVKGLRWALDGVARAKSLTTAQQIAVVALLPEEKAATEEP